MAYELEFDDAFGKRERNERRPRACAFAVVTMGVLIAFVLPILLCSQANSETAIEAPACKKMVKPAAMSAPNRLTYNLIVNRETGRCLDVPAGTMDSRTQVEQFLMNGGDNQMWRIEPVIGTSVRIVNRRAALCLEIPFGTSEAGTPVEQFPINSGSNQGWQLIPVGDHWYRIENDYTGLCLEVPKGSLERRTKIEQAKDFTSIGA
jgi:Ricin-type beta-trefoil lectin domain-like